jgi:hypothetical protein
MSFMVASQTERNLPESRICVKYIIAFKVLCFDTLLEVFIPKGLRCCQNRARCSADSKGVAGGVFEKKLAGLKVGKPKESTDTQQFW